MISEHVLIFDLCLFFAQFEKKYVTLNQLYNGTKFQYLSTDIYSERKQIKAFLSGKLNTDTYQTHNESEEGAKTLQLCKQDGKEAVQAQEDEHSGSAN